MHAAAPWFEINCLLKDIKNMRTYGNVNANQALLWAPGGEFCYGGERRDRRLLQLLAGSDLFVLCAQYDQGLQHPWPKGLYDLERLYHSLSYRYKHVYVGGAGTGGFFALALARRVQAERCVLLCPVLDPDVRNEYMVPETLNLHKQRLYFKTRENCRRITKQYLTEEMSPPPSVLVVHGGRDIDVPEYVATPSWLVAKELIAITLHNATRDLSRIVPDHVITAFRKYLSHAANPPVSSSIGRI